MLLLAGPNRLGLRAAPDNAAKSAQSSGRERRGLSCPPARCDRSTAHLGLPANLGSTLTPVRRG